MFAERGTFVGRKAEVAALDEVGGNPSLVIVRGDAGTGKTALLDVAEASVRARGFDAIRIRCDAGMPRWDLFCGEAAVAAFRNEFHEIGNSRVAAAMAAVTRLCQRDSYRSAPRRSRLLAELERLFTCLGTGTGRVAVLLDDVHTAPDPSLAVTAAYRAGCTVVAACREDGVTAEPTMLSALADRVIDLGPLPEAAMDELLAETARGVPLDAAVAPALSVALGSLAGNPGAMLDTFKALRQTGRLVVVQQHLCLVDPDLPVALPSTHDLVQLVNGLGDAGRHLLAVVGDAARFRLDDLPAFAAAIGYDLDTCGRAIDYLVASGALDCDKWGVLSTPCPALVAAIRASMDPAEVPGVHRAIAEYLLRGAGARPEPATLADHIALAGAELPADPSLVAGLETEADGVLSGAPELAAHWYRAALRHCEPGGAVRARILTGLQRLLIRIGHYRCLAEVVAEAVSVGVEAHQRRDLAVSAAVAAIYTGVPIPAAVHDCLSEDPENLAPLEFCARWFATGELGTVHELRTAFIALRKDDDAVAGEVEVARDWHDVARMFQLVLGLCYGEPVTGPLATYARLRQCYLSGDWSEIPSYARALELTDPVHPSIQPLARLLAAEVLACQGDAKRAAQWLELAGPDSPYPAVYACVEIGIIARMGELDRARTLGWAAYERVAGGNHQLCLPWLLTRLAYLELLAGDRDKLSRLCVEARRSCERFGGVQLRAAELMLRGMADRDLVAATTAAEILRKQGALPTLMNACVVVALLADEPRPAFHEAYGVARRLGDDWMRLTIKSFMAGSGVTPPRYRAGRAELSTVEQSIIALIQRGLTNRQIAASIRISEKTVENHLTRLFAKTGCRSRLDLATASLEGRLVLAGYAGSA